MIYENLTEVEISLLEQMLTKDETRNTLIERLTSLEYVDSDVSHEFKSMVTGMVRKVNDINDTEFEKLKNFIL